ncbi:MAG TPA: hypothetical protein VIH57_07590 [Bacteroidales bacterium]
MINRLSCLSLLFLLLIGCKKPAPQRAFYYWKTTFHPSASEEKYLTDLKVHKIYLRLFDVEWDESKGKAMPVGKISFNDKPALKLEFVPVVYIVNKTLQETSPGAIPDLALKILGLTQNLTQTNYIQFKELQLDCDWTESTREKYFLFLNTLKAELAKNHQTLSATIRLHQIKYAVLTGIPPVHRGMLMYYNMGKIDALSPKNSIYNNEDASKYVEYIRKYPLPLDVALPAFSWGVHIRGNKVIDLLNNMTPADFKNNANFIRADSLQLTVDSSCFFRGFYFMRNDHIKFEDVSPEMCLQAAQQLTHKLEGKPGSVAIFHLDSLIITRYEEKKLEEIFDSFR